MRDCNGGLQRRELYDDAEVAMIGSAFPMVLHLPRRSDPAIYGPEFGSFGDLAAAARTGQERERERPEE